MRRATVGSMAVLMFLAFFSVGLVRADETKTKNDKDKNLEKATITKVDSTKGTITLTMKDENGKDIVKTFPLAGGAEYLDSKGKPAKIEAFQTGDRVLIAEKDGKITELKKGAEHTKATLTKVDAKKGTVCVKAKDKEGNDGEKTLQLMDDAEYFDSTGRIATIDVFQAGDDVLILEWDGKIKELKKDGKGKPGDKNKTPSDKK